MLPHLGSGHLLSAPRGAWRRWEEVNQGSQTMGLGVLGSAGKQAVSLGASNLSLCFSFLLCEMGLEIASTSSERRKATGTNACKARGTAPVT